MLLNLMRFWWWIMANKTIGALPTRPALGGTEWLIVSEGSDAEKIAVDAIAATPSVVAAAEAAAAAAVAAHNQQTLVHGTPDVSMLLMSVDIEDINATGNPSSNTYLRGDGSWATGPPGPQGPEGPEGPAGTGFSGSVLAATTISQAAYDLLSPPVATTLYLVTS